MTPPTPPPPSAARRLLLAAGVVVLLAAAGLLLDRLFRGAVPAPFDFTAFWVAGHLAAAGENPYDPALVRQIQRALGMDDTAIVVWNPPWALTLVMPVGALPFRTAYGLWVLVHVGLMLAAADLLWRGLGGRPDRRWVAYLLALTFVPTTFLIGGGQITAVVLFGLGAFAAAVRADRPVLAGTAGALTAVKPHLLALFALWLLCEAVRTRAGRRVVLGGLAVGALACVPPTLANPDVWADYARATTAPSSADHHHLSRWTPPLAGWWLRQAVPGRPFWVQWLPLAAAVTGFGVWYARVVRNRSGVGEPTGPRSDTLRYLPGLVGVSLLAAPYGVWQHDLVLLLVPIFAAAVALAARPNPAAVAAGLGAYAAVNGVMLAMMLAAVSSEWYVWVVPVVLTFCRVTAVAPTRPLASATCRTPELAR